MVEITLRGVPDLGALEAPWRALENRADASFFQGWTWIGCLAAERYRDPVLLEARHDGRSVALALFNRRPVRLAPATLWLGETGDPDLDTVYVEHNGPLVETGHEVLLGPLLQAALTAGLPSGGPRRGRAVMLSGVTPKVAKAARAVRGNCRLLRSLPAPFVDFAALGDAPFPASLSSSARYQLRRSYRLYAQAGPVAVHRAASVEEAHDFLDALAALHQTTWTGRGKAGAFASASFVRFHRALTECGLPRGEADLLRISAGEQVIGYLYNFVRGGWVGNYQGGFAYAGASPHHKPGLTCHHAAIEFYRGEGRRIYDFMAGEDRYKASLAQSENVLQWLELWPVWSVRGAAIRGRKMLESQLRHIRPATMPSNLGEKRAESED